MHSEHYNVVVVGGGPAGATAAEELADTGHSVLLLESGKRIKPCGGAVPPRLLQDFSIPRSLLCTEVDSACIVSPTRRRVRMPIDRGYVGMVNREEFDPWLRERAAHQGAALREGLFRSLHCEGDGTVRVDFVSGDDKKQFSVTAQMVIGADGANSRVASQGLYNKARLSLVEYRDEALRFVPGENPMHHVAAYHEIIDTPAHVDPRCCEVYYDSSISPDFYGWIFPHGARTSVGVGSAQRGFNLRGAVTELRGRAGLAGTNTVRSEGAPIPLHPLRRWDNGSNVIVAGDAAGVVAPSSGEGIYYAMVSGRLAAQAVAESLRHSNPNCLRQARKQFMKDHGQTFRMLAMMQKYWYTRDDRRERFVSICADEDVQYLTWNAYMNKRLVRARPAAHVRIFFKNIGHLTGLAAT